VRNQATTRGGPFASLLSPPWFRNEATNEAADTARPDARFGLAVQEHRAEQDRDPALFGLDYRGHNLIFCQPDGSHYSPDRVGARVVELMGKVGLRGVSLHSIRHSNATISLSRGVPLAVVSERLGHSDQNITLSVYSHALPADKRAATKVWSDALADVIAASRKPETPAVLADVCTKPLLKMQVVDLKTKKLAGTTGLEPATSDVTGRRSNQLNYVPAWASRTATSE